MTALSEKEQSVDSYYIMFFHFFKWNDSADAVDAKNPLVYNKRRISDSSRI